MYIVIGLIIFLIILAMSIKYGNPNKEIQRKAQARWTEMVVLEIQKLIKGTK